MILGLEQAVKLAGTAGRIMSTLGAMLRNWNFYPKCINWHFIDKITLDEVKKMDRRGLELESGRRVVRLLLSSR